MMTATEARRALRDDVIAALQAEGQRVTAYASPPKQLAGSSVVIGPRSPYRVHDTFSGDTLNLTVSVYLTHNVSSDYLDAIDRLIETLLTAIDSSDFRFEAITEVGLLDEGYIVANIDVSTIL